MAASARRNTCSGTTPASRSSTKPLARSSTVPRLATPSSKHWAALCASHNDGDPVVSYDILAGRWVISQFVVAASDTDYSHQCIAVSTTSDATGEYYLYDFLTDPVNFVDYPHTGVWPDGYYMSTHVFDAGLASSLPGRIYVFERDENDRWPPARMQSADLGAEYGFLPADLDSLTPPPAGEAEFLLGPNFGLTKLTDSFRVAVTWDPAPTIIVTPGPTIIGGIGNAPCVSGATDAGSRLRAGAFTSHRQRTISTTLRATTCIDWLTATTARKPRRRNAPCQWSELGRQRQQPRRCRMVRVPQRGKLEHSPRHFSNPAPSIRTPATAGCPRSRWTKMATSRSATANRARRLYPASTSPAASPVILPAQWAPRRKCRLASACN